MTHNTTIKSILLFFSSLLSVIAPAQVSLDVLTDDGATDAFVLRDKPVLTVNGGNIALRSPGKNIEYDVHKITKLLIGEAPQPSHYNIIKADDVSALGGRIINLPVYLNNTFSISGIQFDVMLPPGVTLGYTSDDESGKQWNVILGEERFRDNDHSLAVTELSNGAMRFVVNSKTNATVHDTSADGDDVSATEPVLTICLNTTDDIDGIYTLNISNIVLTRYDAETLQSTRYEALGQQSQIVVCKETYDVDADGQIDASDVEEFANKIIINLSSPQPSMILDYNGDGKIDVSDIVYFIQKIQSHQAP